MPNRIIKESICTSEEIDILTPEQEVFFYRLMVVVDDFGLMDARLSILKAKCYPLKSIEINCIQLNLARLQDVGLVKLYQVDGKPYLSITNWAKHQQIRAKRAKYPTPESGSEIICNQMQPNAPVIQSNPNPESNPNPIQSAPAKADYFDFKSALLDAGGNPDYVADWMAVRKKLKATNTKTAFGAFMREVERSGMTIDKVLEVCCARGWKAFDVDWMKQSPGNNGSKFLTAQQQRDENNRRSTEEFLKDTAPIFGARGEPIEGEFSNA